MVVHKHVWIGLLSLPQPEVSVSLLAHLRVSCFAQSTGIKFPLPHRIAKVPKEFKNTCAAPPTLLPIRLTPCPTLTCPVATLANRISHPGRPLLPHLRALCMQVHVAEADHFLLTILFSVFAFETPLGRFRV